MRRRTMTEKLVCREENTNEICSLFIKPLSPISHFNCNEEGESNRNSSYPDFCSPKVNPEREISEDVCITHDSEYLYLFQQCSSLWCFGAITLGLDSCWGSFPCKAQQLPYSGFLFRIHSSAKSVIFRLEGRKCLSSLIQRISLHNHMVAVRLGSLDWNTDISEIKQWFQCKISNRLYNWIMLNGGCSTNLSSSSQVTVGKILRTRSLGILENRFMGNFLVFFLVMPFHSKSNFELSEHNANCLSEI